MNEHDSALTTIDPAALPPERAEPCHPWRPRADRLHSAAVDRGVALQGEAGTVCALEYLRAYSVLPDVIQRVLLHPAQRRLLPR